MLETLKGILISLAIQMSARRVIGAMFKWRKKLLLSNIQSKMEVYVPIIGHFVKCGEAEKNVSFDVKFTIPYTINYTVTHIDYEIIYESKVIQTRNLDVRYLFDMNKPTEKISLIYYTAESPTRIPKLSKGWKVKGIVSINCMLGEFPKSFESTVLTVASSIPWEELRNVANG
ncbi:MAG: hypothetical protein H8E40_14670 [Chloroflexi bacterium]|nr:hypothetical protein [Chloroflexota bacterium]